MIIARVRVSLGSRHTQLNFSPRASLTPEIQTRPDLLRTFPDSRQPPVSGAPALLQNFRVDAFPVIADT